MAHGSTVANVRKCGMSPSFRNGPPLDIKICVDPAVNLTALKGFGYDGAEGYIAGSIFRSNLSLYGWGGHKGVQKVQNIARITKAALHKLPGVVT